MTGEKGAAFFKQSFELKIKGDLIPEGAAEAKRIQQIPQPAPRMTEKQHRTDPVMPDQPGGIDAGHAGKTLPRCGLLATATAIECVGRESEAADRVVEPGDDRHLGLSGGIEEPKDPSISGGVAAQ